MFKPEDVLRVHVFVAKYLFKKSANTIVGIKLFSLPWTKTETGSDLCTRIQALYKVHVSAFN